MNDDIGPLLESKKAKAELNEVYKPAFFRIYDKEEKDKLHALLQSMPGIEVFDELYGQLRELVKSLNPTVKFTEELYQEYIRIHLAGRSEREYGVWVFYPWSKRLVHTLDEEEYIEIRTNRNRNKITTEERLLLAQKRVGVIGLSVGQSVALTMTMERSYGEIRLADFDIIEVSNLNRIRTGIHNMNIKKSVITAREIMEIDPFLKVTCFPEGINEHNLEAFITKDGQLDAIIEECDSLDVKINSRLIAKKMKIPVIMDTSDKGMIDIERFDLTPERPILHGLLKDFDLSNLKNITPEKRMEIIYAVLDKNRISKRFRSSIEQIGKTITTWPQLASSVIAGGANTADVYRRMMLGGLQNSGRYYIDLEELIN
jgi:molybdopterin/thiamine biosynthesis adenylyltransferase